MLPVSAAVDRIVDRIVPNDIVRVPLLESTGMVLATDAVATYTLPQWDNAGMDGYAVREADIARASKDTPVVLRVIETVAAGAFPTAAVVAGEATRIMTGAPIPKGADTVIRVEDTDGGVEDVAILDSRDRGKNIRLTGQDFRTGDVVVPQGTGIAAAQIGVLASLGMSSVPVHRRPTVALLGSGDELVDFDRFAEVEQGRKILTSNTYALAAAVHECGGVARSLGNASDSPTSLRALMEQARGADLIVTSAGASVGAFDYTKEVLTSMGASLDFWKVRMRPGAPIGFGSLDGRPWIALPGNPVSAMVTFDLFARPVIRRMLGHERLFRVPVRVIVDEPISIAARLTHFLRASVVAGPTGELRARLTGPQGSGILTSMAKANALLIVPEDRQLVQPGEQLHAYLLSGESQLSAQFSLGSTP